jgi:hypothetical protein
MEKEKSVIDRIFDENDNDPVVLYSNDKAIEFEWRMAVDLSANDWKSSAGHTPRR